MLLLLMSSWIQLSAQTGRICYTSEEVEKIANKMVEANTNALLLDVANKQLIQNKIALAAKDSALAANDSVVANKGSIISLKEEIITGKDHEIADLRLENKKYARKNKWLKFKWAGTSIGLTGTLIYVVLKQ